MKKMLVWLLVLILTTPLMFGLAPQAQAYDLGDFVEDAAVFGGGYYLGKREGRKDERRYQDRENDYRYNDRRNEKLDDQRTERRYQERNNENYRSEKRDGQRTERRCQDRNREDSYYEERRCEGRNDRNDCSSDSDCGERPRCQKKNRPEPKYRHDHHSDTTASVRIPSSYTVSYYYWCNRCREWIPYTPARSCQH